jgi:hypothetical protein
MAYSHTCNPYLTSEIVGFIYCIFVKRKRFQLLRNTFYLLCSAYIFCSIFSWCWIINDSLPRLFATKHLFSITMIFHQNCIWRLNAFCSTLSYLNVKKFFFPFLSKRCTKNCAKKSINNEEFWMKCMKIRGAVLCSEYVQKLVSSMCARLLYYIY